MATKNTSEEVRAAVPSGPPKSDLFRSLTPGPELRNDAKPTMFGHFAEFETWTEINSTLEGHFLERVAPTAFAKTISENRGNIRCLFHHGRDPSVGIQVLGTIDQLEEDSYYEVGLFAGIPPLIMDGLRAGEYGTSYRFGIVQYEYVKRPKRSAHNENGIPELTILEARIREFGPTPIPAYAGTSAGVRSMTDEIFLDGMAADPERFKQLTARSSTFFSDDERSRNELPVREYKRCVETVGETIWAIHPSALATIVGIISERAGGTRPTAEEIRDRIGTRADAEPTTNGSIAVLPLHGTIIPRANLMADISGGVSVESFMQTFRAAVDDPAVAGILIDIDSPGGDAKMVPELAAEIISARGKKPIVAQANAMAASGAYWIAAAADEIVVTPSGEVGSIGVYTAHTDISAAEEKAGIKTTLIHAGEYKVERNPFEPLAAEAQAAIQSRVDTIYDTFVNAVAEGRGVDPETVLSDFGKGRMLLASQAVKAGMADRVATFDETLARMQKTAASQTRSQDEFPRAEEPEPSAATTPTEPEPSEATTRSDWRDLLWFAPTP